MRGKSVVLILIALGCGLIASVGISQVVNRDPSPAAAPPVETEPILVAAADIDVNVLITEEMVKPEEWPKEKTPEGAIREFAEIEGMYSRGRFYGGEILLKSKVSDKNDSNAQQIPPGFRVISMTVDAQKGVSGLILPGDQVDVLVFMRQNGEIPITTTRTVLKDVRVFAVGDKVERDVDENGKVIQAKTVSVLVKPDDVETLHLASNLGTISLTLRRPNDEEDETTGDGATVGELFGEGGDSGGADLAASEEEINGSGDESLQDWLSRMKGGQTENSTEEVEGAEPEKQPFHWTMRIHTPDGVETFEWDDPNSLPIEGGMGDDLGDSMGPLDASSALSPAAGPSIPAPPSLDELAPGSGKGPGASLENLKLGE